MQHGGTVVRHRAGCGSCWTRPASVADSTPPQERVCEQAYNSGAPGAQSFFFNPRLQQNIDYDYDLTK
jgi:hypothetical protein